MLLFGGPWAYARVQPHPGSNLPPNIAHIRTLATKCWHNGRLPEWEQGAMRFRATGRERGLQVAEHRETGVWKTRRNKDITGIYNELQGSSETFPRVSR